MDGHSAESRLRPRWPEDLYAIHGLLGVCHLLVDSHGVVILDTGFLGHDFLIRRRLKGLGLGAGDIRAILLTHGHLDHATNLASLKAWSRAPVYAHAAEQAHLDGTYPYRGAARWCGRLEAFGRAALGYRSTPIDVTFSDRDELPFWGGLRVIHLPGHTDGHCGFYSAKRELLFTGDLFADVFFRTHLPPTFLNSEPQQMKPSLRKAMSLGARWIVPNHYNESDAVLQRRRFEYLCGRELRLDESATI